MKQSLLAILLFFFLQGIAQVPQQINYQGIARNSVGSVIANQNISLRLSVRDGSPTGTVVYRETRNLKTNNFGLFVTAIGSSGASNVFGTFGSINWGSGIKFLQIEIDPTGSTSYLDMGTSQLLSVPYSMYAGAAPPVGTASGDLQGNFPAPQLRDGAVTTTKIADGSITPSKLQAGMIPNSLPPSGTAAGDLSGSYPAPTIANGAIGTSKLQDGSITAAKLAPGVIPTSLPPSGTAAGDLTGTYPNPTINANAVDNGKIADNAVTTNKVADASITAAKLAPGVIPTSLPPGGAAAGDLTGTYPNPTINAGAVDNGKIADNAVTTSKVADGSITANKLAPGVIPVIPATLPPSGAASGDLTGNYPNPTINVGAINTSKIADGSVTAAKLAPGVIPSIPATLPPSGAASGDLSGTYPNPTIGAGAVTTTKIADGSITAAKLAPGVIPTIPSTLPPSGAASGDLNGTYPNPTINTGAVDNTKLADNAVTTNKVVDGSITAAKLAPGVIPTSIPVSGTAGGDLSGTFPNPTINANAVDNTKIADNAVSTSKVVDGSITAAKLAPGLIPTIPATLPPSGAASGDLNGTYPNPTINAGAVDNTKLADNAVTTNKVVDGSITAAKLAPGVIPTSIPVSGTAGGDLSGTFPNPTINANAVDNTKIADNAVSTNKVVDGSITAAKLAPGVIPTIPATLPPSGTASGDLTGTYPNPAINAGAVNNSKLADNAVTTNKVVDGSITAAKLAPGVIPVIPATLPPSGAASGDLTGNYPNPQIGNGVINSTKLANGAVGTNQLQDASVTAAKIAPGVIPTTLPPSGAAGGDLTATYPNPAINNGAVTTAKIADGAVTNTKVADNAITTSKVADGSITAAKLDPSIVLGGGSGGSPTGSAGGDLQGNYPNPNLASGSVTSPKIANGAVITPKIADGAVNTNKLADNSVTSAKIVDGTITAADLDPSLLLGGGGSPTGAAGGDLAGSTYPNPVVAANAITTTKLAANAVTTAKIADGNVTAAKLAPGVIPTIPTTLPPSGTAGGDLAGSYPNPTVATNAITTAKIADGNVTAAKIAPGVIPTTLPPSGAAAGDLTGTYPNPAVAANAITTSKIADNAITTSKVADGSITAAKLDPSIVLGGSGAPTGPAGGDLAGTYPNPSVAANAVTTTKIADNAVVTTKIADGNVTAVKLAPGVIPTTLPPSGGAGGDLTGNYPNPAVATNAITTSKIADNAITNTKVADNSISNTKIADNAITTSKVVDGSITAAKLDPSIVLGGGGAPTGPAGGDLAGTYPNPSVAANAVTSTKIADNAVVTSKIADGNVTAAKLAPGVIPTIPTSLPPNGAAGGDLSGTYPAPSVAKIKGVGVSATAPTIGQVLKYDGTQWAPAADATGSGGLTLPYAQTINSATAGFAITNQGVAASLQGDNSSNIANSIGVQGRITNTSPGTDAAGVRGVNSGAGVNGHGVYGSHAAGGNGVYGTSNSGSGVYGKAVSGNGVFGTSNDGAAGYFDVSNANNYSDAVFVNTNGYGNGLTSIGTYGNGILGIANDIGGAGVFGASNAGGEGVVGRTISNTASGVVGRNDGTYAAVKGMNTADAGVGILAQANVNGAINGTALVAELEGTAAGNTAVFKTNGLNVARIDKNGKGYFNGGTQVGGADLAEYFDVEGARNTYEAGDVLMISTTGDRKVEKSKGAYSTLVAGVFATKPGLMLTELNAENDQLDEMVPMGVIGVIPTKVCTEGGAIKRGDLIVTSSITGVAMKADPDKVKVGQVIGKALEDYDGNGVGKIKVLVSIK